MFKQLIGIGLALALIATAWSQRSITSEPLVGSPNPGGEEGPEMKIMSFRLSEGEGGSSATEQAPIAAADPLPESEVSALLDRLPELPSAETKPFALRDRSLPPPRAGETVQDPFPPPATGEPVDFESSEPLEILRVAPEGDVDVAANISVTFSQPMVPIGTHADLALEEVPVSIEPMPEGRWRWLGTQTLVFEDQARLPMATGYKVTVPETAASVSGNTLGREHSWTFATAPPQLIASYPSNNLTQTRNPIILLAFNQDIDPERAYRHVRLHSGSQTFRTRLAKPEEIEESETAARWLKDRPEKRFMALKPESALPAGAKITVSVDAGFPSAEGPLGTRDTQEFAFRTYGPFQVTGHRCQWGGQCQPLSPWTINFSNPLDVDAFQKEWVRVEPAVEGLNIVPSWNNLTLQGLTKGNTTYRVTLDPRLRDSFGQELERAVSLTFEVGHAVPNLFSYGQGFTVLDPSAKPGFSVFSINHRSLRVRLFQVGPEHWQPFSQFMADRHTMPPVPGTKVFDEVVRVAHVEDSLVETVIDLSPAMRSGFGQVIVQVLPTDEADPGKGVRNRGPQMVVSWVQITQIALDVFSDGDQLIAWATSLEDGEPLTGCELSLFETGTANRTLARGTADPEGLWRWNLADKEGPKKLLVARMGEDLCLLPESIGWWDWHHSQWRRREGRDRLAWYVFDDRGMYRPTERVHLKGWIRVLKSGDDGGPQLPDPQSDRVEYEVKDSRGNTFASGTASLSGLGGFDTRFEIPDSVNLGSANVMLRLGDRTGLPGEQFGHSFQIQEFRRPEYEVRLTLDSGPQFIGESLNAIAQAEYFSGGGLAGAPVRWTVSVETATFVPPNLDSFSFGHWIPWWREMVRPGQTQTETFEGITDARGRHVLRVDLDEADPPTPKRMRLEAAVMDVNHQEWSDRNAALIHPGELYVGLRSQRTFVAKGAPFRMEMVVSDLEGNLVPGRPVEIEVVNLVWAYEGGEWREVEKEPQSFRSTSAREPHAFSFKTDAGGTYRVRARVTDSSGRPNETLVTRWVSGGGHRPADKVTQETVALIPDKQHYQPGDTAEILVRAPFSPAEGLLSLRQEGIVHTERFRMTDVTHTLKVPIREDHLPNVHLQVDLVGAAPRLDATGEPNETLPPRPAFASGTLDLSVPPLTRSLDVVAQPEESVLQPGGETEVTVTVRDKGGAALSGSEIAVVVVDEAILALSGYDPADPLKVFYPTQYSQVSDFHLRPFVLLSDPETLLEKGAAAQEILQEGSPEAFSRMQPMQAMSVDMADMETAERGSGQDSKPIAMRKDFNPLAAFFPKLATNGAGQTKVKVRLPDNVTRYRVMAFAVAGGDRFGIGESSITARLPLTLRPAPPRFLNFGDRFDLPVVVQNQTGEAMDLAMAVRARNIQFTEGNGRGLRIPPNQRVRVLFPARSIDPGTAHFQVAVTAGDFADAAQFRIPVWTPATTEAFATYGVIDEGAQRFDVQVPNDVYPEFGGLEITTASTSLQALTDALLYLTDYPFDCSEQIASRVLAVAALRDVLQAFEGSLDVESLRKTIARDMEALARIQNADGGFGFWRAGEKSWPYLSVHVAHALVRAREKGYDIPETTFQRVRGYLRVIERRISQDYGPKTRLAIEAYALYVRYLMNDRDVGKASSLLRRQAMDEAPMEAIGWLLPVVADGDRESMLRHLGNRVSETAAGVSFTSDYQDGAYLILHSDRRDDGVILESLIRVRPESDLIPKIVRGLLAHKTKGRWSNTQENVFILLALERYFQTYEQQTPDFLARAWLGDGYAGEHAFSGRTTERHLIEAPMSLLTEGSGTLPLVISKEGQGRLYYRLGLRYAPASLSLAPEGQGFYVERTYEAMDEPGDVLRNEDGSWQVKAGARVRVRISMVAPSRRYHVALVDPLPAGLEPLNPSLALTPQAPTDPNQPVYRWWWPRPWYDHQNVRDERVEAFAAALRAGVHSYSYVARATTPGTFVVPPPKAEEMYHPETFGRGGTDRLVVVR